MKEYLVNSIIFALAILFWNVSVLAQFGQTTYEGSVERLP